jgi:hypothetical protein
MKKYMIFVLIFIAVVTLTVFFYTFAYSLVYASSEEFEIYTNEDYGFSIEYPSNWLAKEDSLQPNQVVIFHPDPDEFDEIPSPATVSVWNLFMVTTSGMNISELDNEHGTKDTPTTRLVSKNLTTLSGHPAMENTYYQYTETSNYKAKEIFTIANNETWFVFYNTHPGYYNEYLPQVNQVVESFKVGPNASRGLE